jgi:hypothetical protein
MHENLETKYENFLPCYSTSWRQIKHVIDTSFNRNFLYAMKFIWLKWRQSWSKKKTLYCRYYLSISIFHRNKILTTYILII